MIIATPFKFSKLIIIESLEEHEVKTGQLIYEYVSNNDDFKIIGNKAEYIQCPYKYAFSQLIKQLSISAIKTGEIPLIHVECHGDQHLGLEFENGSTINWEELSALLQELNLATRFNLLATFSACYGGHFLSQLSTIRPSPCYAMIAPTETIDPGEIFRTFRDFYGALFRHRDVGVALNRIENLRLTNGHWFGQNAEVWFQKVVTGYVEKHCRVDEIRNRTKRMQAKLSQEGSTASLGHLKRCLLKANRSSLLADHFRTYFMVDQIPENETRFSSTRYRTEKQIDVLRRTGKYII